MNISPASYQWKRGLHQASNNMEAPTGQPMNLQSDPTSVVTMVIRSSSSNATKDKDLRYKHRAFSGRETLWFRIYLLPSWDPE